MSFYYDIIIQFSIITQQVNPNCSLSICLLNLLIYTNGTNSKWNKIINNLPLFILLVGNKEISTSYIMSIETTNGINESYPIDND